MHVDLICETLFLQTSVQTTTAEVGQATVEELSVKDADCIANAQEPVPPPRLDYIMMMHIMAH